MPQRALDVDVPRTADHAAIGQAHRPINGWGFTCAIYWGERRLWASFVRPGAWAPSSTGSTEGGTTRNRATSSWQLAGASPVRGDARLLDSRTLGIGAAGQDGIGRNPRRLRISTLAEQDPKYGRPYVLVPTPCPGPTPTITLAAGNKGHAANPDATTEGPAGRPWTVVVSRNPSHPDSVPRSSRRWPHQEVSPISQEQHRSGRVGWLRAAGLGAEDGIVSTASLLLGVAAAAASRSTILLAGLAGLVAGAMSMAAGEYVSVSSQRDAERADITRERQQQQADPDGELAELTGIYVRRGLGPELAETVAARLMQADPLGHRGGS
jgi:VIT family